MKRIIKQTYLDHPDSLLHLVVLQCGHLLSLGVVVYRPVEVEDAARDLGTNKEDCC